MKKLLIFSCFLISNAIYSMDSTRRDDTDIHGGMHILDDAHSRAMRANIARQLNALDPLINAYFRYVTNGKAISDNYDLSVREEGCFIAPAMPYYLTRSHLGLSRLGLCTFARVIKTATLAPYTAKRPAPIDMSEPVAPRHVVVSPPFVAPVKQPNARSLQEVAAEEAHQRTLAKRAQRKRAKERHTQVQELDPVVASNLPMPQVHTDRDLVVDPKVKKSNWWFCCRRKK